LAEFKRRYPEITLEIHVEDRMVDVVGESFDVVLRVGASPDSFITSRKIAVVRRGLLIAESLIKRSGGVTRPADLARFPALWFNDRVPVPPRWVVTQGRRRETVPISEITSVNQLDGLHALLVGGMGVAHAPLFFAPPGSGLRQVLPEWEVRGALDAQSGVYALFPGGAHASAKVRVFVDYLVECFARAEKEF
jgi:DNA-binding transcriptional LysR family regulator